MSGADKERSHVIVVDDHAIFRMGVIQSLSLSDKIEVVGEGADRDDALALMGKFSPDVALIDISMPGDGLEAAREIVTRWPATRTVMLTASEEDEDVYRALKLGASGYILKGISARELIAAVEAVATGETFLSPSLASRLLNVLRVRPPDANLSGQEKNVLEHIAKGMTNSEIAEVMGISLKTVKFHVTNTLAKTGAKNRVQLALLARDLLDAQPGGQGL
ncbi:response regulator [Pseudorhizobium flavum]|jgi:two-component system, NarL family, nitrate/nitrite response regulator NarL|uniref:response regulator n=1 Tax=Pseudorhizobium flavum TaxID=1335061 RepID=UPI00376FD391